MIKEKMARMVASLNLPLRISEQLMDTAGKGMVHLIFQNNFSTTKLRKNKFAKLGCGRRHESKSQNHVNITSFTQAQKLNV